MKTRVAVCSFACLLILIFCITGCKKKKSSGSTNNPPAGTAIPALSTLTVSLITDSSAVSGGIISSAGDGNILSAGLCWDTSPNPTIAGNKTSNYQNNMSFSGSLSGLTPNTIYYVRAYATNTHGTAYGNQVSFNTNRGWVNLSSKFPVPVIPKCIVMAGSDLFVATSADGVFKSSNYGDNWTAVNTGLSSFNITDMTVDGSTIFLSTDAGVFYSANQGASWTQSNAGLGSLDLLKIEATGGKLLACAYSDVYLSEDKGLSWKKIYSLIPPGSFRAFHINGQEISLFLSGGISKRIWYSSDNGVNWTNKDFGAGSPGYFINSAVPTGNDFLLATSSGAELLQTNGSTTTLKNKNLNLGVPGLTCMTMIYGNARYASTHNKVYRTTDNGDNWIEHTPELPYTNGIAIKEILAVVNLVYAVRPDPNKTQVLYRFKQ